MKKVVDTRGNIWADEEKQIRKEAFEGIFEKTAGNRN